MQGLEVVRQLPFWCVLIRRELLDAIGLLDEQFVHYGSDNWFCAQANEAGWKCVWVRDVYLEHRHHGSGQIKEWYKRDQKLLRQRLGT